MARMPDGPALHALYFVAGYALCMLTLGWWLKRALRRYEATEREEALKLVALVARAQERAAHGQRFEGRVREWYAKWTPERWGMPEEAVRSLAAILGEAPDEAPPRTPGN